MLGAGFVERVWLGGAVSTSQSFRMLRTGYEVGVLAQGFGFSAVQEYSLSLCTKGMCQGF